MKKHLLLFIMALFAVGFAQSQTQAQTHNYFYTRLGVGASLGISYNLDLLYTYTSTGTDRKVTIDPLALGNGVNGIAAFGFSPSKYFSFEIGISQFFGFPKIGDSVMKIPGGSSVEVNVKGNMLSILPAVILSPGFKTIDPYARFGFLLGIRPTINVAAKANNNTVNPPVAYEAVRHYYGGIAAGIHAALGVTWHIDSWISMYAELAFQSVNYSPKHSEVVLYEKDGIDQLPTLSVKQTKTDYYTSLNPDEDIPETSPDKELRKSLPFSNTGFNFGVIFHF